MAYEVVARQGENRYLIVSEHSVELAGDSFSFQEGTEGHVLDVEADTISPAMPLPSIVSRGYGTWEDRSETGELPDADILLKRVDAEIPEKDTDGVPA